MDPLNLNPVSPLKPLADLGQTGGEGTVEGPNFSDILKQAL